MVLAEWELHDGLGHNWSEELIYYDLTLTRPISETQPLTLLDGAGQAVPVQIMERRKNALGQVIQVQVALQTDLPAFGQRHFRLLAAQPKNLPTDLSIKRAGSTWIIGTGSIGITLPAGELRGGGQSLAQSPAPVMALRGAGNDWVGKGWLTGQRRVINWKTEILATGPVLAWARISYEFAGGENYVVDVRVPAGQPVILVREERKLPGVKIYETDPERGEVFHLALAPGLQPTHVYSKRGLGSRGYFIEAGPEFKGEYLTPGQLHFLPTACNIAGTWRESNSKAQFIGLFTRFLSHWTRPRETPVPLVWDKENGLTARFFLNDGVREWGLMAGPRDAMLQPRGVGGEGSLAGYFDALLLNNKWGETPLDKVKGWTLDWGQQRYQPGRKYGLASRERGSMPYFAEQFLLGGQKWEDTAIHVHQTWTGETDGWERYGKSVPGLPPEQILAARAAAAFVMHKQTDPDYWPAENWIGPANPNMKMMGHAAILLGALALGDHPNSSAWVKRGVAALQQHLAEAASPDGVWLEAPGYDGAGIAPILRAALELHRRGRDDLLNDEKLLRVAMAHVYLLTPPDQRVNGLRHLPELGDSFNLQTDKDAARVRPLYWKPFALAIQKQHPKEAGNIIWALGETEGAVPFDGQSRQLSGFGSVFRHAFNTPKESYLAIHQDSFSFGHYHYDLGALYLFGLGVPLAVDWPSLYSPQISSPKFHNGVTIAGLESYEYTGRVNYSALSQTADYSRARLYYDASYPPTTNLDEVLPQHCWQRQVLFVKGTEANAYVVVRDAVNDSRPSEWNLWTLSGKLRLSAMNANVTGLYGVNLAINFFVGPAQTPTTETYGFGAPPDPMSKAMAILSGEQEVVPSVRYLMQQTAVRIKAAQGGEYGAVLYPYLAQSELPRILPGTDGTVTVRGDGGEDTILLYPSWSNVQSGNINFHGRAGLVSRNGAKLHLELIEGDTLELEGGPGIRGKGPIILEMFANGVTVSTDGVEREISINWPGKFSGQLVAGPGIRLLGQTGMKMRLRIPSGKQLFRVN